jgi:hypothetical protein
MTFGPLQMLIVGFDGNDFDGEILPELHRLRDHDIVRLVDLLIVSKAADGTVTRVEMSDLNIDESIALGELAAALAGVGDGEDVLAEQPTLHDQVWYVADEIPPDHTAAIAILEHRWAIPLRESIERAGGKPLADAWLHPSDVAEFELGMVP